jgi:hypothetical protein
LLCSLALGRAREYLWAVHVLALISFASMSFDTTLVLTALHPKSDGYFLFFLEDYKPNQDIKFSLDFFTLAFQCMSHL